MSLLLALRTVSCSSNSDNDDTAQRLVAELNKAYAGRATPEHQACWTALVYSYTGDELKTISGPTNSEPKSSIVTEFGTKLLKCLGAPTDQTLPGSSASGETPAT